MEMNFWWFRLQIADSLQFPLCRKEYFLVIKLFLGGFIANSVGVCGDLYELYSRLWVDYHVDKSFFSKQEKYFVQFDENNRFQFVFSSDFKQGKKDKYHNMKLEQVANS